MPQTTSLICNEATIIIKILEMKILEVYNWKKKNLNH